MDATGIKFTLQYDRSQIPVLLCLPTVREPSGARPLPDPPCAPAVGNHKRHGLPPFRPHARHSVRLWTQLLPRGAHVAAAVQLV